MGFESIKPGLLLGSAVYALLGVVIFWLCFLVIDKLTPYKLWEEIVEHKNIALAIVVGAMCISIGVPVVEGDRWFLYYAANSTPCAGPGQHIGRASAPSPVGPWERAADPLVSLCPTRSSTLKPVM